MNADHHPHRRPSTSVKQTIAGMRAKVTAKFSIEPERLRYHDPGQTSDIVVSGERWQIYYRDAWRDLPGHFDGPTGVTRELVRIKAGLAPLVILPGGDAFSAKEYVESTLAACGLESNPGRCLWGSTRNFLIRNEAILYLRHASCPTWLRRPSPDKLSVSAPQGDLK